MNEKRIKELLSDEGFAKELLKLETPEAVQAAFKAKGAEINMEEINWLRSMITSAAGKDGEMSSEDLDGVAGGSPVLFPISNNDFAKMFPHLNLSSGTTIPETPATSPLRW
jgi:hypothetical protein